MSSLADHNAAVQAEAFRRMAETQARTLDQSAELARANERGLEAMRAMREQWSRAEKAEARLAAVVALCDKYSVWVGVPAFNLATEVRAAATGDAPCA